MNKESVIYSYNRILFSHKNKCNLAIYINIDGPLEKGVAIHSSVLAWTIPLAEDRLHVREVPKSRTKLSNLALMQMDLKSIMLGEINQIDKR